MKTKRTLVMGDIHGAYRALIQCMERCGFDNDSDTLIQLGDVADGWPEVKECVDYLMKVNDLVAIKGNHDEWCYYWMLNPSAETTFSRQVIEGMDSIHYTQGGKATLQSYHDGIPVAHLRFFEAQRLYFKDDKGRVFVHGGFDPSMLLDEQEKQCPDVFTWDRELLSLARLRRRDLEKLRVMEPGVTEIFIGHTQTRTAQPENRCNLWNLDTGAGWNGKLTIMDVDTKEYWQSDNVLDLYPGVIGRSKMK